MDLIFYCIILHCFQDMKCKHLYFETPREDEKPKSLPHSKFNKKMNKQIPKQKIPSQLGHLILNFQFNSPSTEIKKENERKTQMSKSSYLMYKEKQQILRDRLVRKKINTQFEVSFNPRDSRVSSRRKQNSQEKKFVYHHKQKVKIPVLVLKKNLNPRDTLSQKSMMKIQMNDFSFYWNSAELENQHSRQKKIIQDKNEEVRWRPWSPKDVKDPMTEFMGLETTFI